eukprot:19902_1
MSSRKRKRDHVDPSLPSNKRQRQNISSSNSNNSLNKQNEETIEHKDSTERFVPYVIYCRGFICDTPETPQGLRDWAKQFKNIVNSQNKFSTIILDSLNILNDGSLKMQNQPPNIEYFIKNGQLHPFFENGSATTTVQFESHINILKTKGGVKYVGFTTESGVNFGYNWTNIVNILKDKTKTQILLNNFEVLLKLGINMWDSDYEGTFTSEYIDAHVTMFTNLKKIGFDILTCSPFDHMSEWTTIAEKIFQQEKKQILNWWNIQTYGGANPKIWYNKIQCLHKNMGLSESDAKYFITGLVSSGIQQFPFSPNNGNKKSLNDCQSYIATNKQYFGGCGIWQLFTCYGSNTANFDFNWADLYCKSLRDGYQ